MKPGHLSISMQGRTVSGSLQAMPATMTTNTLTPTTLKTITQIFESDACLDNLHRYEETGGFEPPTVLPIPTQGVTSAGNTDGAVLSLTPASAESSTRGIAVITRTSYSDSKRWQGGVATVVSPSQTKNPLALPNEIEEGDEGDYQDDDMDEDYEPDVERPATSTARRSSIRTKAAAAAKADSFSSPVVSSSSADKRRGKANKRGRKPAGDRAIDEESLSPTERKRLNVRRERNKQAAARCRNRRLDLTNKLSDEVEVWEGKKKSLTQEIHELTAAKRELEFVLEAHSHTCQFSATQGRRQQQPLVVAIKSEPVPVTSAASPVLVEPVNAPYLTEVSTAAKLPRPSSLPFASGQPKALSPKVEVGVDIETPSVILPNISFDSLVGTGLTPTTLLFNSIVTPVGNAPMLNTPTCSRQHYARSNKAGDAGGPEYLQL